MIDRLNLPLILTELDKLQKELEHHVPVWPTENMRYALSDAITMLKEVQKEAEA